MFLRCILERAAPRDGFVVTQRQWLLLLKTAALAGAATVTALLVAVPGACVVARTGGGSGRALRGTLLAAPLLFPPMVYVFGWQRILPPAFPGVVACVGVWALWAYPIPALLLGARWARWGRGIYDAALLDTSPVRAVISVVLPVSARTVAAAATVLWVLFLGEYSVPHACGLSVYATELLGWAEDSAHAIDPFWLSLPLAGLMLAVVVVLGGAARWRGGSKVTDDDGAGGRRPSRRLTVLAATNFVVAALVPIAALAVKLLSLAAMCRTFQTYRVELAQSLTVAGLSGLLAVLMGVGLTMRHAPPARSGALGAGVRGAARRARRRSGARCISGGAAALRLLAAGRRGLRRPFRLDRPAHRMAGGPRDAARLRRAGPNRWGG